MKEKITLFVALSFVLCLTVYKTAVQDNAQDNIPNDKKLVSEVNSKTLIDSKINQTREGNLEKSENIAISPKESRAQSYIDLDWLPDDTIDEITYKKLGGQHTDYWDKMHQLNLQLVQEAKNAPIKKAENKPVEKAALVQN